MFHINCSRVVLADSPVAVTVFSHDAFTYVAHFLSNALI